MSAATATGVIAVPASPADQMRIRADLPDAVREALLPHEHVVWAQRGQGFRWPLVLCGLAVASGRLLGIRGLPVHSQIRHERCRPAVHVDLSDRRGCDHAPG